MMERAIRAINLTKCYGRLLAVDHIDFEVKKGEIFGFLGPNGAGKTTTVRMLTGVSKPTEGSAEVMGYDIQKQSVEAKELMGIVPDISNVYTDLSAWGNLIFTGRLYDVPKAERERRAGELLKLFGLFDRRHEIVQVFSRGMKRRLCIAMALMNKSSILFLDEPTSGLDVQSVITIRNLVRKLNEDGLTIFLTTHNMEEANQMCDRVAIINRGKIAAIDTPERLKKTIKKLQFIEISFVDAAKNLTTVLLGKTIAGFIYGAGISLIPILVGVIFFQSIITDFIALIAGIILSALVFAAMGIMFASIPGQGPGQVMMPLNFVRIPLLFISGVFIPVKDLPVWGQLLSMLSPITSSIELVRGGLGEQNFFGPLVNIGVLTIYLAVFLFLGIRFHIINQRKE